MSDQLPDQRSPVATGRKEDGTFDKGNSPNPGGQAKWLKQVREELRALLPHARATLSRVMVGDDQKAAVQAAKVVLEYTVPKPKQTHRLEGKNGDALAMVSAEALVAFVTGKKEGT